MRIATYNIHGWLTTDGDPNLDMVAATLESTGADVIGLNEVVHGGRITGFSPPALESLAARLGMHYVFGACLRWPAQDALPEEAFGNALLSRWPILASANHLLTPVADKAQRALLEARIQLPDEQWLTVYVTHLDHTDEDARITQLRALSQWTSRDRNRPHIVMGDFNSVSPWDLEGRPAILSELEAHPKGRNMVPAETGAQVIERVERSGYVDAYTLHGAPGARSYLPSTTPIRIDYIFVSQPLTDNVRDCVIWESTDGEGSDHLPVVAEVDVP